MKPLFANINWDLRRKILHRHTPSMMAKSAYFYVQSAGHFSCAENYYTCREGYKSYLLIYTVNGKGHANLRGQSYELTKDQVILIDCYDYQEYFSDKTDLWEIKWIHFYGASSEGYVKLIQSQYGPVHVLPAGSVVPEQIDSILQAIASDDIQFEVKTSSTILQILTEILLIASASCGINGNKNRSTQVEAAIDFIEANYNAGISLAEIAKAACLSPYYFTRLFKQVTGYSPYEYLIKYRITKAKTLLASTNLSIEMIAHDVGFESESNFIKTFKVQEEMTPSKFRKLGL